MKQTRLWLGTAIFAVSILLSGCGAAGKEEQRQQEKSQTPAQETPAGKVDVAAAEQTYQQYCISCHGQNLEGGMGPKLSDIGTRRSEEEILKIIQNGVPPKMPGGLVTGQEAENLAAWLATKK